MTLEDEIAGWLGRLCDDYPDRHVGGPGNRAATDLFEQVAGECGFEVETAELDCIEWERGPSSLEVGGSVLPVNPGPYSSGCDAEGPLRAASTIDELEAGDFTGSVLLLHGEVVRGQLMAKNFTFYNPESHKRIVAAIERQAPVAIVAATGMNPDLAGGVYPFPLVEDGDFAVPSAYIKDVEGDALLARVGDRAHIRIDSRRVPSRAAQPVARKRGTRAGRVLLLAHVDSKDGTPGALDNATGVCALLGAMRLLAEATPAHDVEVIPFNGEDYYAVTGQMWWLGENAGKLGDVVLGLNTDGAGFAGEATAVSFYGVPERTEAIVRAAMDARGLREGPQWPQGDHSILAMNGVPAIAVTSENVFFIAGTVAHTDKDRPGLVDATKVADVARFFADVALALD